MELVFWIGQWQKFWESLAEGKTEEKTKIRTTLVKRCILQSPERRYEMHLEERMMTSKKHEEHIEKHKWAFNHNFGQIKYISTSYKEQEKCVLFCS